MKARQHRSPFSISSKTFYEFLKRLKTWVIWLTIEVVLEDNKKISCPNDFFKVEFFSSSIVS